MLAHMNNPTSYCIYRIVNIHTGKIYIGQSKHIQKRRIAHFLMLRNNKHHSAKLQAAYNKYGESSFYFEIIEREIPLDKINEREIYWINYYDSLVNGYNMKPGGQDAGGCFKPFTVNGIEYLSKQDAAEKTGLTVMDIDMYLKNKGIKRNKYRQY